LKIFQCASGLITRHPLIIKLKYAASQRIPKMVLTIPGKPILTSTAEKEIHDALKASHDAVEASGVGISDIEGVLEISCYNLPNIEIIDLPGMMLYCKAGEPETLPLTAKNIAKKYISKPGCTVLFIADGRENQRNSPAMALLNEVKPETVITVYTKVDCLVDNRQTAGPLASFLEIFNQEEGYAVALCNYEPKPNCSFQDISEEEMKMFKANLDYFSMSEKIGIDSLLRIVNQIAEGATRAEWAVKQKEREQKELTKFEAEYVGLGPELKVEEIITHACAALTSDDACFENLIQQAWQQSMYVVPTISAWFSEPNFDINVFLRKFEALVIAKMKTFFLKHALRLHRFRAFEQAFYAAFSAKMAEKNDLFIKRFQRISEKIMLDHDTLSNYSPEEWLRGAKCCLIQSVLMNLKEVANGPVAATLASQLSLLMQGLSADEHPEAAAARVALQLKIKTLKEILQILPSQ
jgi:hypothetical protein